MPADAQIRFLLERPVRVAPPGRPPWGKVARPEQLPPPGEWFIWLCQCGRGWGKTRTGAEWVREKIESGAAKHVALVAPTAADARDVMIGDDPNAESGLLQVCYPKPVYEPSKRRVTWPSGATAVAYSADQPERLRGPQHDLAWADEVDAWGYRGTSSSPEKARSAWSNLLLGLRLGEPQAIVTSTPKPGRIVAEVRKMQDRQADKVVIVTGSTFENRANLADAFFDTVVSSYDGTRLGRQEIGGEILEDVEGALWTQALIDLARGQRGADGWLIRDGDLWIPAPTEFRRIVIAVDPAVTARASSDETGIVPCASLSPRLFVLGDHSGRLEASRWAERAVGLYENLEADLIVGEVNNGGDLVERNLRTVPGGDRVRFKQVRASRGKAVRAEPVVSLYEQRRVFHLAECPKLEDEMTTWVPDSGDPSPSRVDSLVWGLWELSASAAVDPIDWSQV